MELRILIQNLINIEKEARNENISKEKLGKLEIVERHKEKTLISKSIKFDLAKDENGNLFILKSDYGTYYDNVMENLGK